MIAVMAGLLLVLAILLGPRHGALGRRRGAGTLDLAPDSRGSQTTGV